MSRSLHRAHRAHRAALKRSACLLVAACLVGPACQGDGPTGPVPGGTFDAEPESGAEPDWSLAAGLDTVDVQIDSFPPRSVRTGIVIMDGVPYLPVTYAPFKLWDGVVAAAPRVVLRVDSRPFERCAVAVTDENTLQALIRAGQAKYGPPFHASWTTGMTGYFRLDPPCRTPVGDGNQP